MNTGCGKEMTDWIMVGFDTKEIQTKCGYTRTNGLPYLCEACEKRLAHVNWYEEAALNGESIE